MLIPVTRWRTEASLSLSLTLYRSLSLSVSFSSSLSLSVLYWLLLQYAAVWGGRWAEERRWSRWGVGVGGIRNDNPIWRRYGCSVDRAQPSERSVALQAGGEPRIGRRGRRRGEEGGGGWFLLWGCRNTRWDRLGYLMENMELDPGGLQNTRPRAPPAVWRNTQGVPIWFQNRGKV